VLKLPQPISKKANPSHVQHLTHTDPELSNLFVKVAKPIVADNEAPIHAKIHSKASGRSHLLKRLPKPIVKTIAPVAEPLQDDDPILNEIFDKVSAPVDVESESHIHTIHGRHSSPLDQRRGPILSGRSNKLRRLPRPVTRKAHAPAAEPLENADPELTDIFMKVAKPVVADVTSPRVDQSSGNLRISSASSLATKTSSYSKISKPSSRNFPSSNTQAATVRAITYTSAPSIEASFQVQRRVNKPRVANFQLFQSANRHKTPSLVIQDQHVGFEDDTSVIPPTCPDNKYTYIIPHSEQCDAYYTCEAGNIKLELCPDGLVFSIEAVKCVEIQYEKCEGRPALQPPQGVAPCDRENGVFNPNDSCDGFVTCRDNVPVHGKCAPGLVFNPEEKVCAWADEVLRADCLPSDLLGFICPNPVLPIEVARTENIQLRFGDHDRHADVNDCRYFFTCLTTGHPRRAGCGGGKVFDIATGACTAPEGVEGCEEYYKTVGSKATKETSYRFKGLLAHVNQG